MIMMPPAPAEKIKTSLIIAHPRGGGKAAAL
jgi:hypothetical protein